MCPLQVYPRERGTQQCQNAHFVLSRYNNLLQKYQKYMYNKIFFNYVTY